MKSPDRHFIAILDHIVQPFTVDVDEHVARWGHYDRLISMRNWYHCEYLKAYIRCGSRYAPDTKMPERVIALSSVDVEPRYQNQGMFKELITQLEEVAQQRGMRIMVESVMSRYLQTYLPTRKYTMHCVDPDAPPDYWKTK